MIYLDEQDQRNILDFISLADITNFPDATTPEEDFLDYTHHLHDIIKAYNGDIHKAAGVYSDAREQALDLVAERYPAYRYTKDISDAKSLYCQTMKNIFFKPYIQYRWQRLKGIRSHASIQAQYLYRSYVYALNAEQYVDYRPLLVA